MENVNNKELRIQEDYLDELISFSSRKMVGKILKRFDLDLGKEDLKNEVKELIHENWRDFKDLLFAHQYGLGLTQFNFKRPKKNNSTTVV